MRFLIALSLAMNVNVGIADETKDQCVLQDDTREELLALSFKDFDQSKNGWRQFQASGCFEIIRDLLASYIQIHPEAKNKHYMLTFHTGQFYAFLGDYDIALKLFAESYSGRVSKWSNWDAFVDANIAFLEKNVEGLEDARDLISEQEVITKEKYPSFPKGLFGRKINLDIVNGYLACLDKSYDEAYHRCRR